MASAGGILAESRRARIVLSAPPVNLSRVVDNERTDAIEPRSCFPDASADPTGARNAPGPGTS